MMIEKGSGFIEVEHTADWALKVWAPDLPELFTYAAHGMAWLMQMSLEAAPRVTRTMALEGVDHESLLVLFLSELLYLTESEGVGFDRFELEIKDFALRGTLYGAPVGAQMKEIKAVTYHNLKILHSDAGFSVTVVFDV
jgi:SHS2 domain-containing protein